MISIVTSNYFKCDQGTELKLNWIRSRSKLFIYHLWIPAVRGAWEQPARHRKVTDEMGKPKINERRTKQQVWVRNKQTQGLVLHPPAPPAVLYQLLTADQSLTTVKGILDSI